LNACVARAVVPPFILRLRKRGGKT
jgi:hypothetical protein